MKTLFLINFVPHFLIILCHQNLFKNFYVYFNYDLENVLYSIILILWKLKLKKIQIKSKWKKQ